MTRMQWVFRHPCGCPLGVMEAGRITSETAAFSAFYEQDRFVRRALNRGVTAERMPHERYVAEVMPKMLSAYTCPHRPAVAR